MTAYQPSIPTGLVNLDVDYQNIQGNFQQLETTFSVDHIPITQAQQNGYHTSIHFNPVSTTSNTTNPPNNYPPTQPTTTPGYGQLYSAQVNDGSGPDEALFFLSGGGRNLQLTSNILPSIATNGYTFLPGGLLIQWGQITSTASSFTQLNFNTSNINFPNACLAVFTQIYGSGTVAGAPGTIDIRKSTISNTGFQWAMVTQSSNYTGFFWVAIGN